MLTFLTHSRTMWNDYFTGTLTFLQSNEYRERKTPSDTSVYVLNSLFTSITSGSDGGALYCSATYLLVESTSFFSCKTSGQFGGAIRFTNTNNGQCVLNEVCSYDCCSTNSGFSFGQFDSIEVQNVASSKNYVNYSSISRCVNGYSESHYTMRHHYGKICYPSVNMSMNKCYHRSGIYCLPYCDSNSVTCSLSYCSFVDNIATGYTCILLWTTGAKYEIESCNILRNKQPLGNGEGTIYTHGNLIIENSCILENIATYIFRQGTSSYTITLSNCTVDLISNNGYLTTKNTITKSFIHALNHLSTRNCHSEYDSAGTLTANIQPPSPSKKQIHCCTCVIFFYQPQLSDFFSFAIVIIFNFILPYSSNYPLY